MSFYEVKCVFYWAHESCFLTKKRLNVLVRNDYINLFQTQISLLEQFSTTEQKKAALDTDLL